MSPLNPVYTGFSKPCAAICYWKVEFQIDEINRWGKRVEGKELREVLEKAPRSTQS